jgi:hypothetical protein
MNDEQEQTIVVRVPPQRLRWLAAELRSAGLPFEVERAGDGSYHVQTMRVAAPQLRKVLDPAPSGWDPLCRRKENRSLGMDTFGFVLVLSVMAGVVWLSGGIVGPALAMGLNPDLMRAAAIMLGGLVAIRMMLMLVGNDPRRWMLAVGMALGLLAAVTWFAAVGVGLPMQAELERLLR